MGEQITSSARMFSLAGQVAVVTGGGSGIGQRITVGMAEAGADVVPVDVNETGIAETTGLVETSAPSCDEKWLSAISSTSRTPGASANSIRTSCAARECSNSTLRAMEWALSTGTRTHVMPMGSVGALRTRRHSFITFSSSPL